ncbi:MAG: hypothetical protein KAJ19_13760 [Gammaproteobacteria bacterium]|nr:hypothetical protein [Gammaproteobacteria bacterium]
MPTDNEYLKDAVERLCQGLVTIREDPDEEGNLGDLIVTSAQTYALPYPSGSDWVTANPLRLSRQEQPQGSPFVEQTWDVPTKIGIGNLGQELGGIQQAKLWERIPMIINWITEHPHLQFAEATEALTYLDTTIGVKVSPGAIQARVEDQETSKIIWFEIIVQIPFRVPMNTEKYQDGQLITVT